MEPRCRLHDGVSAAALLTWYSCAEHLQILVIWFPFESIQLTSKSRAVVFPSEHIRHGWVKIVIRKLGFRFGNEPKQAELKQKDSRNGRRYPRWYETNCFFTVMNLPLALDQPFDSHLRFFNVQVVQKSTRLLASTSAYLTHQKLLRPIRNRVAHLADPAAERQPPSSTSTFGSQADQSFPHICSRSCRTGSPAGPRPSKSIPKVGGGGVTQTA